MAVAPARRRRDHITISSIESRRTYIKGLVSAIAREVDSDVVLQKELREVEDWYGVIRTEGTYCDRDDVVVTTGSPVRKERYSFAFALSHPSLSRTHFRNLETLNQRNRKRLAWLHTFHRTIQRYYQFLTNLNGFTVDIWKIVAEYDPAIFVYDKLEYDYTRCIFDFALAKFDEYDREGAQINKCIALHKAGNAHGPSPWLVDGTCRWLESPAFVHVFSGMRTRGCDYCGVPGAVRLEYSMCPAHHVTHHVDCCTQCKDILGLKMGLRAVGDGRMVDSSTDLTYMARMLEGRVGESNDHHLRRDPHGGDVL